jgi:energy-coupling factor transport system permease protein
MDLMRSLPLGLYLEQPITWLHRLDARVKLAWLCFFLLAPILCNGAWRLALVGLLMGITLFAGIPPRVWRQQMGLLVLFCLLLLGVTAIAPDGLGVKHRPHRPANELTPALVSPKVSSEQQTSPQQQTRSPSLAPAELPQPTAYRYVLLKVGPITITRRSVDLALRVSTLLFTLIYSTTLYLLTTAPEEITASLEELMYPLKRLGWPITELSLTLTLSLRFIPLVLEEIQNLGRAIQTRAINWKQLGVRGTLQIWIMLADRLLENLLLRSEQMASAMQVRGFTSPSEHQVLWHQLRLRWVDWLAIALWIGVLGLRLSSGWELSG